MNPILSTPDLFTPPPSSPLHDDPFTPKKTWTFSQLDTLTNPQSINAPEIWETSRSQQKSTASESSPKKGIASRLVSSSWRKPSGTYRPLNWGVSDAWKWQT